MMSLAFAIVIGGGDAYNTLVADTGMVDSHTEPYVTVTTACEGVRIVAGRAVCVAWHTVTATITPTQTPASQDTEGLYGLLAALAQAWLFMRRMQLATTQALSSVWGIPLFGPILIIFWVMVPILFVLRTIVWGGD